MKHDKQLNRNVSWILEHWHLRTRLSNIYVEQKLLSEWHQDQGKRFSICIYLRCGGYQNSKDHTTRMLVLRKSLDRTKQVVEYELIFSTADILIPEHNAWKHRNAWKTLEDWAIWASFCERHSVNDNTGISWDWIGIAHAKTNGVIGEVATTEIVTAVSQDLRSERGMSRKGLPTKSTILRVETNGTTKIKRDNQPLKLDDLWLQRRAQPE
jgi:hypothetical protein